MEADMFQEKLIAWYRENKRDLPWRKQNDPYSIWVSEIMLQQTKVDTVIPYYQRFMERFPTMEDLAQATEEEVLKMWEGLGYYSRAKNLWLGVKEVKEKYGGIVPDSKEEIINLPGIGSYTAGAILSIAYGKKTAAVDGNVMRVISRVFNRFEDITKAKTKGLMERMVEDLMPDQETNLFTQALMELGALICTPKNPQCLLCPFLDTCEGRKEGNHEELPIKAKKKPPKVVYRISLLIDQGDFLLIEKRPSKGLLANMYELPSLESDIPLELEDWEGKITHALGITIGKMEEWMKVQHTFSHIHWNLQIVRINRYEGKIPSQWERIQKDRLKELVFPKAYHKVIDRIASL